MLVVQDTFNSRVAGEVVTSSNSIFDVVKNPLPSPQPTYEVVGRLGTTAIHQKADPSNPSAPVNSIFTTSLPSAVDEVRLNVWAFFKRTLNPSAYTSDVSAFIMLFAGNAFISLESLDNDAVLFTVATDSTNKQKMLYSQKNNWFECEIIETRNNVSIWIKDLSGDIILQDTVVVTDHTPVSEAIAVANVTGGNVTSVIFDNFYLSGVSGADPWEPVPIPEATPAPIVWDSSSSKPYEYGLSKGVLYLRDGLGIPWNGLTSIAVNLGQEPPSALYFDGIKYLDKQSDGELSASINALTYPEEFLPYDGVDTSVADIMIDGQMPERFSLSFRTETLLGYRIHLLYNVCAKPTTRAHSTELESIDLMEFSWDLSAIPVTINGYAPTEYYIFDSEEMDPLLLETFESILYGNDNDSARLPDISNLADFAVRWNPQIINEQVSGTHTLTPQSYGDITPNETFGYWSIIPSGRLLSESTNGLFTLE